MTKRVLIAVGGTGGHIYPAIALAKKLKEQNSDIYITFAGGGLHTSRFFDRQSFPYNEIACGYFPLRRPLTCLKSLGKIASGVWQSGRVIKEFNPDIVVGFGSHHSLPILVAAKIHGIPIVLHEGNIVPGKVNRLLAKYALATGIQFPDTAEYLNGKTLGVDMPLREGLSKNIVTLEDAKSYFELEGDRKTLLVFGGSQGAFTINRLIKESMGCYRGDLKKLQVMHCTGDPKETDSAVSCYRELGISACVKDFESEMGRAWTIADLVIARAGANTIAEAIEFEVPSILLPYPHATDDHQTKNAQYMVNTVRGGVMFAEKSLTSQLLADEIYQYFEKDTKRLDSMMESIVEYKTNFNQNDMCTMVTEFIR